MSSLLEDKSDIGEVLVRYATGIDQRDWDLFRSCWTSDVVADYGEIGQFNGIDALTDFMFAAHDAMGPTHHALTNFAIDVQGDRADVRCYVHAILIAVPGDSASWVDAVGHYDDKFVRTAEGWRINHRTVHIARVMSAAGAH